MNGKHEAKDRQCRHCQQVKHAMTAKDIKEHAFHCEANPNRSKLS